MFCLFEEDYFRKKKCNKTCEHYETCSRRHKKEEYLPELERMKKELKAKNVHSLGELQIYQSYSLEEKIRLSRERIDAWYNFWHGMVYVSFSGGKDSTVVLDIVRNVCGYTDVPAVFVDTGLEYPEIREFVKTFDNVVWLRPKKNFKQVINEYGYPFISKEVSKMIHEVRVAKENGNDNKPYIKPRLAKLNGEHLNPKTGELSPYNVPQWKFLLDAPFKISLKCCDVMKKEPAHRYSKETGRMPILGTLASESRVRTQKWIQNGCNAFYSDQPVSNPLSFWTDQDILLYIKTRKLNIASVYGDIVEDLSGTDQVPGQYELADYDFLDKTGIFEPERPLLKTTGCDRTGCMFCGFGCHLNNDQRFVLMRDTHPKQWEYIMKSDKEGGLNYEVVINWLNQHGDLDIETGIRTLDSKWEIYDNPDDPEGSYVMVEGRVYPYEMTLCNDIPDSMCCRVFIDGKEYRFG